MANPQHRIYIVSKGRWESRLTSKCLEAMGVPYHIVVEPQERDAYAAVIDQAKILVLPFSNLEQGSIPARNWIWEHAISTGASWHWILDDNIRTFYRLWRNRKVPVWTGTIFKIAEDFVDRYENVGQAGFQYDYFVPRKDVWPAFYLNTRVYSCILIRNDLPYRWRGRYNEDTDLSLQMLKDGWCTILFLAFLAKKISTLLMKGGNTDELYGGLKAQQDASDGRLKMAEALMEQHPDVTSVNWKWGRWQHQVNYAPFKRNALRRKPGLVIPEETSEYGMILQELIGDRWVTIPT